MIPERAGDASQETSAPGTVISFAPLVVPVLLIALKSIADYPTAPLGSGIFRNGLAFIGHPVVALIIGVFLAFGFGEVRVSAAYHN